jgi:hypothetical protein
MRYGIVRKTLIFGAGDKLKCLIEMSTIAEAVFARVNTHGFKLIGNFCTMNVFFSDYKSIDLRHNFSRGFNFECRTIHNGSSASVLSNLENRAVSINIVRGYSDDPNSSIDLIQ